MPSLVTPFAAEGVAVSSSGSTKLHAINNYYAHGTDTTVRPAFFLRQPDGDQYSIYLSGNIDTLYRPSADPGDEWDVAHGWNESMQATAPVFDGSGITTATTSSVPQLVLQSAGAVSPQRDPVDARIISGILNNTGAVIDSPNEVGRYQLLPSTPAPTDSDGDGMPDEWEFANGLDADDPADGIDDRDADGYTEPEEFLNSLIG